MGNDVTNDEQFKLDCLLELRGGPAVATQADVIMKLTGIVDVDDFTRAIAREVAVRRGIQIVESGG